MDIDSPIIDKGVAALFGQHPERGGQERRQAVFAVLQACVPELRDREIIEAMLARAGVVWENEEIQEDDERTLNATIAIAVEQGKGPKNIGYTGFAAVFYFGSEDQLVGMGAWE